MARRLNVLLISPPVLYAPTWWSDAIGSKPHLYSLAGFVRDLADVQVIELENILGAPTSLEAVDEYLEDLGTHLPLDGVDLVGISCWTSLHYLGAVEVARHVRREAPRVPIVVGGHHPTAMASDFMTDERLFDFVVRADGEHALRALCTERPARGQQAQLIEGRPFDMRGPDHIDWASYPWHREDRVLWLCSSRSCPFMCSFCAEPRRGMPWSSYAVDDLLGILDGLANTHAPRVVCFADPLFGAKRSWTLELLEGIKQRDWPTMFWAETRADLMTPELLELFRDCKFKLDFGLDTGDLSMVQRMNKAKAPERYLERARESLRCANRLGLLHELYLIFNYPGETPETVQNTQAFVESLAADTGSMSGWVSAQTYFILPGTDAYRQMEALHEEVGFEVRNPSWWRQRSDHHALATDVLASRDFEGRQDELLAFQRWQHDVNVAWIQRATVNTHLSRAAFYHGG